MSRHSPTGFAFSMIVEIAAVVIIVSLLPRFDLRPSTAVGAAVGENASLAPSLFSTIHSQEWATSIEKQQASPRYVEERLDRASQQLVNSVGSAVVQATGDFFAAAPLPAAPRTTTSQSSFAANWSPAPERRITLSPQAGSGAPRTPIGSFPIEPRPWVRY